MRRSGIILIILFFLFGLEMSTYALDAFNIWNNFVWVLSTFILLTFFIIYIRLKANEKADELAEDMFAEKPKK